MTSQGELEDQERMRKVSKTVCCSRRRKRRFAVKGFKIQWLSGREKTKGTRLRGVLGEGNEDTVRRYLRGSRLWGNHRHTGEVPVEKIRCRL